MGFLRPVQFAILPVRGRLAMECRLQAFFDQTLPCAMHRRQAHADQDGDLLVRGPWPRFPFVSTQQHLGPLPRRLRHATACYQMLHRISFGTRQPHHILGFLAHVRSPAGIEIARMRNTVSEKACQFRLGEALATRSRGASRRNASSGHVECLARRAGFAAAVRATSTDCIPGRAGDTWPTRRHRFSRTISGLRGFASTAASRRRR